MRTALVLLLALPAAVLAQGAADTTSAPTGRPTVGLVLSGGSAKGLAHVGAIRAIEAAGIPIDVVTGTSMGAVVGGLYAVGYPVDSLEAIVESRDWVALFDDAVDRRLAAPEDRVGEGAVLVSLPIQGGSIGLPSGLVAGQSVFGLLADLLWPVQDVRDFRELPRPFAAVVVDVETGAPVRLDSGYLPLAIRASMSLPSLFEPVEIDGRRYIDGGIARNLPAQDALALGADVLVCVDVSSVIDEATEGLDSFFDVLVNAAFYQSDRDLGDEKALCDVLIEPETKGLSAFSFDAGAQWIARGEAAAQAQRPALDALAARVGAAPVPTAAPAERSFRAEAVAVRGVTGVAERLVRRRLHLDLPADLAAADVQAAVARVYASGAFALVTFRVVPADSPDAATVGGARVPTLVLDVRPDSGDRVGFGFRYDTAYDAALLFSLRLRNLVQFGSTTRLEARLGEQVQLRASLFTRLGFDTPLAVASQAGYTSVGVPVFGDADRPTAQGRLDVVSASIVGGPVVRDAVLTGIGPTVAWVQVIPEVAPAGAEGDSWTYGAVAAFAAADDRDRPSFPTRGVRLHASAEWAPGLGASFRHVVADVEAWTPLAPRLSAGIQLAATRAWGDDVPTDHFAFVGGAAVPALLPGRYFRLYGTKTLEFSGPAGQVAAASVQAEPRHDVFVRLTANAGRAGERWSLDPGDFRAGVGLTLAAATPLGPVGLTMSTSEVGRVPDLLFSVGRTF